jgi:hypothetical protein
MTTIQKLVDTTISNLEKRIDIFTLHETVTVILSTLMEEDYFCWLKLKEIMERANANCDEQPLHNMPPEVLAKFIEYAFLMKLALNRGKQLEIDHVKTHRPRTH